MGSDMLAKKYSWGMKMSRRRIKAIVIFVLIGVIYVVTCTRLKTPEINGVVVDAETGKPIADTRIYAKWERKMRGLGGEYSGGIDKELHLKTKTDGSFLIPAHTLFNFIPSPIGIGGDFYMFVYAIGYKNLIFDFFNEEDFEGPPKPRYIEFEGVSKGKQVILRTSEILDPKTFIKNGGEVFRTARPDKEFELKEDRLFVERFGEQKWTKTFIQYELAEAYYRLGDYESALKKLDEILETNPKEKTIQYFKEKYAKYKAKLNGAKKGK
jgi:hypothetical protein